MFFKLKNKPINLLLVKAKDLDKELNKYENFLKPMEDSFKEVKGMIEWVIEVIEVLISHDIAPEEALNILEKEISIVEKIIEKVSEVNGFCNTIDSRKGE